MAGRKQKDRVIKDGFNLNKKGGLTKREEAAAKRQIRLQREQEQFLKKQKELEIAKLATKLALKQVEGTTPEDVVPDEEDDTRSSDQMLSDMRWVYKKVQGRRRLKELIESDDKQFVFMVKELMKIEAAKILKTKDDGSVNQTVFVVLKGLDEEKKYEVDDKIDMKQVQHVIQPEAGQFEPIIEEEKIEVIL
jgi:hypothetical protein